MTFFRLIIFLVFLFSFFLSYKVSKRINPKKTNIIISGFIFLTIFCINSLILSMLWFLAGNSLSSFLGKKYEATIIDINTYYGTSYLNNSRFPRNTIYYKPVVKYMDKSGNRVQSEVNIGSSLKPSIGEKITISDNLMTGAVNNSSLGSNPIILLGFLFISILSFFSSLSICYGLKIKKKVSVKISKRIFFISLFCGILLYILNIFSI